MKKQNEKKVTMWMRLSLFVVVFVLQAVLFQQNTLVVNAQGTAKVSAASGKIRASASTSSEVLASVTKGNKLDVIAQTTDKDGYTWYKVYVDGQKKGYIRADLVSNVTGTIKTESASETQSDNSITESDNEPTQQVQFVQVNPSDATAGKIIGADSVNVRENPSTSAAVAGKANKDTEVTIAGEAVDNSGKIWYQVSFGDTTGFVRSDYLEVTSTVAEETEASTEISQEGTDVPQEEPQEVVNKEYEVIYEANAEGVEEWFLYDHNRGTKQSLEDLLAVVRQTQDNEQSAASQLKTYKLLAIVMIAIIIALIIVVTILAFKLRDAYEYEYDDEDEDEDVDEDEDDDEEVDVEDEDDDEEEFVVRKPIFKKSAKGSAERSSATTDSRDEMPREAKSSASDEVPSKDTPWQSKNFLDMDDDMEFEFLDLK